MKKRIHIVVNPASGVEVPILFYINKFLRKRDFDWTISVTKKPGDARRQIAQASMQSPDIVAVYGGDGTVMEAAQALFRSTIPLAIIPGGTANVIAKELKIPEDIPTAIQSIQKGALSEKRVDMALLNNERPFLIRINLGILADMVKNTDRDMKNKLGRIAYGIGVAKDIMASTTTRYHIALDGKKINASGISMVVANSGNIGVSGVSLVPHISVDDGTLDVVLFKSANITSIVEWFGTQITGTRPTNVIKHWKAKEISVTASPMPTIICDDEEISASTIDIKVVPQSLSIIAP